MSRLSFRPRPLDILKKLPIVKSVKDLDNDEASLVAPRLLAPTENEAVQSSLAKQRNGDIPIPQFTVVESYKRNYTCSFVQPPSYVRSRGARNETSDFVEYDLDDEDEDWLQRFDSDKKILMADRFEWMLYKLEVLDNKVRERVGGMVATLGVPMPVVLQLDSAVEALQSHVFKSLVIAAVYNYWKSKRERWQKPILRRFQPPPAVNDANPFNVFRPREKAHRPHTRRLQRRENDVPSFEKLRLVRYNLEQAQLLVRVLQKREEKKRELMECEANSQRTQLTYKDSLMDYGSLVGVYSPYPRNKSVPRRRDEDAAQRLKFLLRTPDLVNGNAGLKCGVTPPSSDGVAMFEQVKRKGKRRRLLQPRARPAKMVTAVDPLEPAMLFTRGLDAELLASSGIIPPPFSTCEANGSSDTPFCFKGRIGRGGRVIFDRWNPLTCSPLVQNTFYPFSRCSVPRSHPPPPRLNSNHQGNSVFLNPVSSDKIVDSTVHESVRI